MMMALGTFAFAISTLTYQQLQRSLSWRHPGSDRVGARAGRQYVGPGDETVRLSGVLAAELAGDRVSLDVLRSIGDDGLPVPLVDGMGRVYGAFVLTDLEESQSYFFADGTPRKIEFSLTLQRVDEQAPGTTATVTV